METNFFIQSLETSASIIDVMLRDISDEQARWKPEPTKWSILEVMNHLYDEERDDFRKRLDLTLNHPDQEWPGIDPEGWVSLHQYNKKGFRDSIDRYLAERKKSLQWLRSLSSPQLDQHYSHPIIGKLSAGDLLAAWAAHDYLHIRQLANIQVQFLDRKAEPFSIRYASP